MRLLYNILFIVFFCLSAPYYFLKMWRRGNWREGFEQRFGRHSDALGQALEGKDVVWLHAVSVGEVNICTHLIKALEPRLPGVTFVVSTTTTTGMGRLREALPAHIEKIYYPVDRRRYVRQTFDVIRPAAVILMEAEIWPNFLWELGDRHIPAFLVNARLSDRSFPRYCKLAPLFAPLFGSFAAAGAQNEKDSKRLAQVGCRADAICITGNLKFDTVNLHGKPLDVPALFRQTGWPGGAPILVAGSTHEGEETVLAEIHRRLRQRFPELRLVLVPRHFERCKVLAAKLRASGTKLVLRSELSSGTAPDAAGVDCLLVDSTGELIHFYREATVVFVGKSLHVVGGQNPIEPGALGRAMVFGPHMENFRDVAAAFLNDNGARQVRDEAGLESAFAELLADESMRRSLGENALKVVRENQGAVQRTVDMLMNRLAKQGLPKTLPQ